MKKACFARTARKGFTLLEALFAVLIIAVLAAVAIPMYINNKADAELKTCQSNIRAIASAESKYKFDTGAYIAGSPAPAALIGQGLAVIPTCPLANAAYSVTVASGVATISCANATHSANSMSLQ
jgi:prepilin-type N-terminal cleavage/methylation domain-containing protein